MTTDNPTKADVTMNVRVPNDLYHCAVKRAETSERTLAGVIRYALRQYLIPRIEECDECGYRNENQVLRKSLREIAEFHHGRPEAHFECNEIAKKALEA